MIDQPKSKIPPAPIVERNPAPGMPPKPAGEWTADSDGVLWPSGRFIGQYAKQVADAHNAAVAAERQLRKYQNDGYNRVLKAQEIRHREELAEAVRDARDEWISTSNYGAILNENKQLRKQLTAEQQKVQTLVDALKDMFEMIEEGSLVRDISRDDQPDYTMRMIHFTRRLASAQDALAKVKEGK